MVKLLQYLRGAVYVNILTIQITFFSTYAALGLTYGGMTESNLYKYFLLISSILCYSFLFYDIIILSNLKKRSIFFLLIPFVVLLIYLLSGAFTEFTEKLISLFILLVVPSMLVGYILAIKKNIQILKIGFFYVSIIILLGIIRSLEALISSNVYDLMTIYGGGQYQALSYFSAFGFSSILCYYLFYKLKRSWFINMLYLSALLVLLSGVVLSGGRGGAVVVIMSTLILMYIKYGFRKVILAFFVIAIISSFALIQLQGINNYDRIMASGTRLFSYISADGIDLTQTSNRDAFYNHALLYIKESLFFGYGPFSYVKKTGDFYSHNIFLDILLHGGIVYLSIWIIIFIRFFMKLKLILKNNTNEIILLIPILSSFILLMFSGTYLEESLFWFSISYVFNYKIFKNTTIVSNSYS